MKKFRFKSSLGARLLLGLALLGLSSCATQGDLAQDHQRYSQSLRLAQKAHFEFDKRNATYVDMISHCSNPAASPYHELLADLNAMQNDSESMATTGSQIRDLEGRLQKRFGVNAKVAKSDDAAWKDYQVFESDFEDSSSTMSNLDKAFRATAADFDILLEKNHIEKRDVEALRTELEDYLAHLDTKTKRMEDENSADHREFNMLQMGSGGNAAVISEQEDLLNQMDLLLTPLRQAQENDRFSVEDMIKSLPGEGQLWTGPGMEENGTNSQDVWKEIGDFNANCSQFETLQQRFISVPGALPLMP